MLVYESRYQNPIAGHLVFDVASVLTSHLVVEQPNFDCNLQIFTIAKKGVFDKSTAIHLGTTYFKIYDLVSEKNVLNTQFDFES